MRSFLTLLGFVYAVGGLRAGEPPSYAKHIRPILAKYCLECHNPKAQKGGLDLESFQGIVDGGNKGVVLVSGEPDKSRLVTLVEGKVKPQMPPKTAKHHPKREEVALLREWVKAGAKDDSGSIKVALPEIKPRRPGFPPVTALAYRPPEGNLEIGRLNLLEHTQSGTVTQVDADRITAIAWSRDGGTVAVGYGDAGKKGSLFVNKGGPDPLASDLHKDIVLDLAISPDAKWIATCSYDTQVHLTPVGKGKSKPIVLKDHSDAVYGVAFSPDGKRLATCSADRAVKVWDVATGTLLLTLGEANDWLYAVAWNANNRLAAGGLDKSVRLYEIDEDNKGKLLHSVFAHEGGVQKLIFSRDGAKLYSLGQEGVVKVWQTEAMKELRVFERQPQNVQCLAVSPDDKRIALGRYDGIVVVLDEASGKVLDELKPGLAEKKEAKTKSGKPLPPDLFPLQKEGEGNESPSKGTLVTLPASIHGSLERAGDCDFFRFKVTKGQQLGIQVVTAAIDSKVEPYLQLVDLRGNLLAESSDGLLGHTFAEEGTFALGVRDRELKGGAGMVYRLHLGPIPVATSIFPLGVQQGQEWEFRLQGVFLDQAAIVFKAPADAKPGTKLDLPITSKHGKVLGKTQVVVGELTDVLPSAKSEAYRGVLTAPATANGILDKPGAADPWRFSAKKSERLIVDVEARRLGSPLDSVIEILNLKGEPVERAVLRCQAKTYVTFRDHDSVQGNVRIEAWNDLAVNDFIFVGGELLRIQALPTHPDADCNFFTAGGLRTGFLDTTPTHLAMNEPMYKVSIHPPGSKFPPNGFPVFTLPYRNDDGGPGYGRDSRIFFDAPADGDYLVKVSDAKASGGPAHAYRLTVRPPRPSFNIRFSPDNPSVWRGGSIPITVTADRLDGYDGPIQLRLENLPEGFHAPLTDIAAGLNSTTFALFAEEKAMSSPKPLPIKLVAEATAGGKKIVKEAMGQTPKVVEPGDIVTHTVESEISLKPGGITRLTVDIERRNGFTGRVPLEVRGLPHGVRVLDIGLNGILITESETRRTIQIYAEPWVEATNHPIVVLAKKEGKNTEHGAKSVLLKVGK